MPNQKGTGKHGHKDTEEPYPHTAGGRGESGGEGGRSQGSRSESGSGGGRSQGSRGESEGSRGQSGGKGGEGGRGQSGGKSGGSGGGEESSDLKSREYRDEQGNIHHHTRTYQEQHGGGKSKK